MPSTYRWKLIISPALLQFLPFPYSRSFKFYRVLALDPGVCVIVSSLRPRIRIRTTFFSCSIQLHLAFFYRTPYSKKCRHHDPGSFRNPCAKLSRSAISSPLTNHSPVTPPSGGFSKSFMNTNIRSMKVLKNPRMPLSCYPLKKRGTLKSSLYACRDPNPLSWYGA